MTVRWDTLQKVVVRTNDRGPLEDDVFIVLTGGDCSCEIPNSLEETEELIGRLGQLPGFKFEALIESMSSTDNAEFLCWDASWNA